MTDQQIPSIARMRKRHAPRNTIAVQPGEGRRLFERQSLRDAVLASVIVIIVFSILWAMLSTLTNRVLPWMTVLLGVMIGFAVRRAGQGVDWRFPALAAIAALLGALVSNIVVAAAFTARLLETSTLTVLRETTVMTWPVFFDEVMNAADAVYALVAAAVAAFYANRQLSRAEYLALRKWQEYGDDG